MAATSIASPISGSSSGYVAGLLDRVEFAVLEVLDPWREPVAEQVAQAEHMISRARGVGVVLCDPQVGLVSVVVQGVQDVRAPRSASR